VPCEESTLGEWVHPPYSGHYDGEFVWGRGAVDDKSSLIGILAAIETMLEAGFSPKRTVIVASGFDEGAA
jgi:Gly-Xaa carboxypeptidase